METMQKKSVESSKNVGKMIELVGVFMGYQVELKNITKDYSGVRAVDHVSLQIAKGEIVSLLGPSGCGKTTTLRIIAGLIAPTGGTVEIEGKDVTHIPPYKRDIAMVFQNYALFPHLTVFENIVYSLRNKKIKDIKILQQRAQEVLDIVQLEGVEKRYPRQLSGGQQQRVSLARALIVEPKVMLFDEPLSNLDAKLREQTRIEIRKLLKTLNSTAIFVTHDQEEALTISDRIAVINKGKIEQITTPKDLYCAPSTKFVANFVGHANLFDGILEASNNGIATIKTSQGIKILCHSKEAQAGNSVHKTVLIRPENITLSLDRPDELNVFKGKVEQKSFLGSFVRYMVCLEAGALLEINVHPEHELNYCECETVYASFDNSKLVLIDKPN